MVVNNPLKWALFPRGGGAVGIDYAGPLGSHKCYLIWLEHRMSRKHAPKNCDLLITLLITKLYKIAFNKAPQTKDMFKDKYGVQL